MAITDFITKTRDGGDPVVATVASSRSGGGTSLTCDDLDNWPNDTVHFITYQKTAAGGIDYDTLQNFKGIVSGNTIGTVTLKHSPTGSDLGNSIGDYVEMAPTATWSQDLYDGLIAEHGVDGTHDNTVVGLLAGSQTFTGDKTFSGALNINGANIVGAWSSWTPTFTNLSGGTLNYAKYKQVGKTVFYRLKYTLGGAGVSGSVSFTLPVAENAELDQTGSTPIGTAIFRDNGTLVHYGHVHWDSSGKANLRRQYVAGTSIASDTITSTTPFTWASSDNIILQGFYEAA